MQRHPELKEEDIVTVFISPCTAKTSYVKNGFAGESNSIDYVVSMNEIYFELIGVMKKETPPQPVSRVGMIGMSWAVSSGEASALLNDRYLAVDGIENIIKVLDELVVEQGVGNDEREVVPRLWLELRFALNGVDADWNLQAA